MEFATFVLAAYTGENFSRLQFWSDDDKEPYFSSTTRTLFGLAKWSFFGIAIISAIRMSKT